MNNQQDNDSQAQLVSRLKKGDPQAVKVWFKQYHQQLLRVAKVKISNSKDAEDVVQEVMINCLRQIQLFRQDSSLKTWMMSILRHEIADYYRKIYAKKALTTVTLCNQLFSEPVSDSQQVQEVVKNVLSKMSGYRKDLLLMKYVDGLKIKQIAKKLGKTFKAVESEIWRSKLVFKEMYAQEAEKVGV